MDCGAEFLVRRVQGALQSVGFASLAAALAVFSREALAW